MQLLLNCPAEEVVAIRKEDWPDIHAAIAEAVAPLRPSGWKRLLYAVREWGGVAVVIGTFLALLAWAAYEHHEAITRVEEDARFRTHTEDRLTAIESSLKELKGGLAQQSLTIHSALPLAEFKATLPALTSAVMTAGRQNIKVSPKVLDDLQNKLMATDAATPNFWPTAAAFVSYRSFVNSTGVLPNLPSCTDTQPTPAKVSKVIDEHNLEFQNATYEHCRITLDSGHDAERINSILSSTLAINFKNCLVVYRGGTIDIKLAWMGERGTLAIFGQNGQMKGQPMDISKHGATLYFENCLFEFSSTDVPPPSGRNLTGTLLAQNGNTLRVPNP